MLNYLYKGSDNMDPIILKNKINDLEDADIWEDIDYGKFITKNSKLNEHLVVKFYPEKRLYEFYEVHNRPPYEKLLMSVIQPE